MVGVIHRDESGPALLRRWLEEIQPDVITLELSHYGIRFRRELGDQYKEIIVRVTNKREERGERCNSEAFASLISYVSIPYEYEAISGYAAEQSIPFHLIDMDFFSYVKLRAIEDLLSKDNIEAMLADMEGMNGNLELATARLYFDKGINVAHYDREMYIRDRYMAARIDDLMKHRQNKKFLHVCGWQHLQDPSGLYSHFNPIKVFSHDKTFCL
jgi:hypothetical protein